VALLDICKAYDRVPRDFLYKKMELMGFSESYIKLIMQVYRKPQSRLNFQGVKTEPLDMPIGLRQGCVLSPLLFALFIADLGRKLEKSDLGVKVGGKKIPGIFFADDMVLFGNDKHMEKILQIVFMEKILQITKILVIIK